MTQKTRSFAERTFGNSYDRGDDSYRQFYPIHIDLECRLSRRIISIFQAHFLVLEPKISIHIAFFGRFLHDFEELRVASPPNCDDVMSPAGTESSGDPRRLPDPIPIHSTPFFSPNISIPPDHWKNIDFGRKQAKNIERYTSSALLQDFSANR